MYTSYYVILAGYSKNAPSRFWGIFGVRNGSKYINIKVFSIGFSTTKNTGPPPKTRAIRSGILLPEIEKKLKNVFFALKWRFIMSLNICFRKSGFNSRFRTKIIGKVEKYNL